GLGLATLGLAPAERLSPHDGVEVRGRSLVNRFLEVALEPSGALALRDRRTGERFFDLLRLEDGGDAGDTYTYCPPARDRVVRATGPIKVRRLAAGPLVAALEARQSLRGGRVGVRFGVILDGDRAPGRGGAVARRPAAPARSRRLADAHAARPVPGAVARRARRRARVAGGRGTGRHVGGAVGGHVPPAPRLLAARRGRARSGAARGR